jgi:hypothetical protein
MNILKILVFIGISVSTCFVGVWTLRLVFKPNLDVPSARVETLKLLTAAGGAKSVLEEADSIFDIHRKSDFKILRSNDLAAYPALTTLGSSAVVLSGSPRLLTVHVGTHRDGFFIEIVDTNAPGGYKPSSASAELFERRIYVQR